MINTGPYIRLSLPIRIGKNYVYATKERSWVYRQASSHYYGSVAGNPFDQVLCLGSILCSTDWIVTDERDPGDSHVSACLYFIYIVIGSRKSRLNGDRSSMAKSCLIALLTFIPILASVLSFVRHPNTLYFERLLTSSFSIRSHTL
jgi:hypothetical protein